MKNQPVGKACSNALTAAACVAALVVSNSSAGAQTAKATDWQDWGGDAARTHFSPLQQITAANVSQLKPAWVWDPGTFGRSWEITPLLIDGLLIVSEPGTTDVVALEPESGKEIWRHKAPGGAGHLDRRGFAYWAGDGTMKPRIVALWGHNMYGLDPKTGEFSTDWPAAGYGVGLPNPAAPETGGGGVFPASPPIIYKNLIIVSGASGFLPEPAQPADPHAIDLRTGKLVWTTRLIPGPGQTGADSWGPDTQKVVGSGTWGIMALDEKNGIVYTPTDSPSPDLVGIWRPGDNVGGDSTFALDAMTGKIIWGFQNHHHDLFDQDTMSPPVPVEVTKDGKKLKVIVQTTKQGMMWIIDDKTGKPLFPYEERPVPQSEVPGEKTSRTQPFTMSPPPLAQMTISRDNLSNLSPHSNADCQALWDKNGLKAGGPFLPPAKNGAWTVMNTGAIGGINWGGASIDLDRGYAITNVVNMPTMIQVTEGPKAVKGNDSYNFSSGYKRFSDSDGRTCAGGRHGELVAVELATGKIVWRVPLGALDVEYGEKAKEIGATNIGPSLVTRGGVVFIGAATDDRFHAYDTATGKLLWQTKMATSSNAGPMTYIGKDGRQYVVIAAGGPGNARRRSPTDNFVFHQTLVAFALPKPGEKEIDIVTPYPKREPKPGDDMGLAQ
jgi:quinoprotein glucose dehydrogenase